MPVLFIYVPDSEAGPERDDDLSDYAPLVETANELWARVWPAAQELHRKKKRKRPLVLAEYSQGRMRRTARLLPQGAIQIHHVIAGFGAGGVVTVASPEDWWRAADPRFLQVLLHEIEGRLQEKG